MGIVFLAAINGNLYVLVAAAHVVILRTRISTATHLPSAVAPKIWSSPFVLPRGSREAKNCLEGNVRISVSTSEILVTTKGEKNLAARDCDRNDKMSKCE